MLVNCPSRWSLYLSLALCVDHSNGDTGTAMYILEQVSLFFRFSVRLSVLRWWDFFCKLIFLLLSNFFPPTSLYIALCPCFSRWPGTVLYNPLFARNMKLPQIRPPLFGGWRQLADEGHGGLNGYQHHPPPHRGHLINSVLRQTPQILLIFKKISSFRPKLLNSLWKVCWCEPSTQKLGSFIS